MGGWGIQADSWIVYGYDAVVVSVCMMRCGAGGPSLVGGRIVLDILAVNRHGAVG